MPNGEKAITYFNTVRTSVCRLVRHAADPYGDSVLQMEIYPGSKIKHFKGMFTGLDDL